MTPSQGHPRIQINLAFTTSKRSDLQYFLHSDFTELGLIDDCVPESLSVGNVLVRERRSKIGQHATKRSLVNKLERLVFANHKLHKVVDQSISGKRRCLRLPSDNIVKAALTSDSLVNHL
jgi:hypothetical protein